MKFETLKAYLAAKPGATEDLPFGPEAVVFKVQGKMFALVAWDRDPMWITLKCNPLVAEELRELWPAVRPGYYMNKKHWNTVTLDGSIPEKEVLAMIDDSYRLVVAGLTRAQRRELEAAG